ncbi:bifunctional hydroxymethylpyrimidine kinase/phosphomethylpyrimidine kinase [Candidatus Hydrogenedentota bacterium]
MIPRTLTIAGSDPSGGAGVQADLKTFTVMGTYGMAVITALTAQNTQGVTGVRAVELAFVRKQMKAVLDDIETDAVKTGMLWNKRTVMIVAKSMEEAKLGAPLVVDPVMIAKGGAPLLAEDAVSTVVDLLFPRAAVITPNTHEASLLTGIKIRTGDDMEKAAEALLKMGPKSVFLKGGHTEGDRCDDLFTDGDTVTWLRGKRLDQKHTHGTGCTLSAAIAACLAKGRDAIDACSEAKRFVTGAILNAYPIGKGVGPVNHVWEKSAPVSN